MKPTAAGYISRWLPTQFALAPVRNVRLLRAYTNDVFLVMTGEGRYVLKLYGISSPNRPTGSRPGGMY